MEPSEVEVVVAADNEPFRARVVQILQRAGITPAVVGPSSTAYHLTPDQWNRSLILLDTNDDVARLVQIVNDLHRSPYHLGGALPVMCVVSADTFEQNQSLGFWLIEGHAAVSFVWTREGKEFEGLLELIRWLSRPAPAEPPPCAPGFEHYLEEIQANPANAEAYLGVARLLMDSHDVARLRMRLSLALIRQSLRINSNSAPAHARLALALICSGKKEEANIEAREAIRLEPNLAEAHLHLGSALCDLGLKAEARAELETAIALDDEGRVARWARSTLASRQLEAEKDR